MPDQCSADPIRNCSPHFLLQLELRSQACLQGSMLLWQSGTRERVRCVEEGNVFGNSQGAPDIRATRAVPVESVLLPANCTCFTGPCGLMAGRRKQRASLDDASRWSDFARH